MDKALRGPGGDGHEAMFPGGPGSPSGPGMVEASAVLDLLVAIKLDLAGSVAVSDETVQLRQRLDNARGTIDTAIAELKRIAGLPSVNNRGMASAPDPGTQAIARKRAAP